MGLTKNNLLLGLAALAGVGVVIYLVRAGNKVVGPVYDTAKGVFNTIEMPIAWASGVVGRELGELRYGKPGTGVEATESYVVLRQRDFDQYGTMKESAYIAASGMHSNNARILQVVLSPARVLREPYRSALAKADPIIITPDGKINTL